ncbi:MAG: hypothetical protein WAN65_00665 [Candidatus Sulfotelmatobacter sp.]
MSNRDKWCRHRTAFTSDIKTCNAGVDFHQFDKLGSTPNEIPSRRLSLMPCLGECPEAIAKCDKYSGYTPEEIAAHEADLRERITRIGTIRTAIIQACIIRGAIGDKKSCAGQIPCPACKTGTVQYSRASNGHVHARCSTANCASWME